MKYFLFLSIAAGLISCKETKPVENQQKANPLVGTWELTSSKMITKGDTSNTFNPKDHKMVKMFNETDFAFFKHDFKNGKDSSAFFSSGGGRYKLDGNKYSEHLEYCNYREWEGHDFDFTLTMQNDTIIQKGIEKIDSLGIDQEIVEVYVRVK